MQIEIKIDSGNCSILKEKLLKKFKFVLSCYFIQMFVMFYFLFLALPDLISNDNINDKEKKDDDEAQIEKLMSLMSSECSEFKNQCVGYISGFVLKMLCKLLHCDICCKACLATDSKENENSLELFDLKQRGPLLMPSKDLTRVCITTENAITLLLNENNIFRLLMDKNIHDRILNLVMRQLSLSSMFLNLKNHQVENMTACLSKDHTFVLFYTIIHCYSKIIFFHCLRIINNQSKTGVRQKLYRLTIFMNQ